MCLGVPGQVVEISDDGSGVRMGKVDFGGIRKEVCLAYLPEIAVGDYAIVHVGFAITKLDEQSARQTLEAFRELGVLEEELGVEDPAAGSPPSCPAPTWKGPAA
jgi:hydrogenase expression/formation protein HypC